MPNVTIKEVAAAAKVSKTTASDILCGASRSSYSAATVEHVRGTAERLGYQANAAARLLRQGTSNIIGIAVGVRQRAYLNSIVVAAHEECIRRGFQPALFEPAHLLPSRNHSPFPSLDMLAGILSIDLSMERSLPEFYASLHNRLPVVALYPTGTHDVDAVATDWALGLEMAVEHLVGLGHRDIAFAHDPSLPFSSDRSRAERWQQCISKFGLSNAAECAIDYKVPESLVSLGERVVNAPQPIPVFVDQIIEALRQSHRTPTALICTSDELALALISRLGRYGWQVPRDLSMIGFYGIDFGAYFYPSLTTIAPPTELLASGSVDRLIQQIENYRSGKPAAPREEALTPVLIGRESTSAPRTESIRLK